jgi:hypothetical protein
MVDAAKGMQQASGETCAVMAGVGERHGRGECKRRGGDGRYDP